MTTSNERLGLDTERLVERLWRASECDCNYGERSAVRHADWCNRVRNSLLAEAAARLAALTKTTVE